MKNLKLSIIGLILLYSCDKEDDSVINPNLITGTWRLEQVTFNQTNGTEINDWISNSTILKIDNNKSYYRNYVGGEWSLDNQVLVLNPGETLPNFYWEYKVLELTEGILIVQISLTEGEYCCDFDQFKEDEVLMITEKYIRSE